MLFNVRHVECEAVGEGKFVEAKDAKAALLQADPVFQYHATGEDNEGGGDADSWLGVAPHLRHLKPVSGSRPPDIRAGTEPYQASIDGSHDYYWVYQVASIPIGKKLDLPL